MKIEKIIQEYKFIKLVKTEMIMGGNYAVINGDRAKTGLTLDAAYDLFKLLKKLG
jgi:hypothetical protein